MKNYKVLVLEDSFSDQLTIEMILENFQGISTFYAKNSQEFGEIISTNHINIVILDIILNESSTGLDLMANLRENSVWLIVCSAHECKDYYTQLRDLKFTKFFIQKPVDEFVLKTHLDTFIYSHHNLQA